MLSIKAHKIIRLNIYPIYVNILPLVYHEELNVCSVCGEQCLIRCRKYVSIYKVHNKGKSGLYFLTESSALMKIYATDGLHIETLPHNREPNEH
jgi:hypothetical protein